MSLKSKQKMPFTWLDREPPHQRTGSPMKYNGVVHANAGLASSHFDAMRELNTSELPGGGTWEEERCVLQREFDFLRGRMDTLSNENALLRKGRASEVYSYSLQIDEIQGHNRELSAQVETVMGSLEEFETENILLRDEIQYLKQENEHRLSVINDLEKQNKDLNKTYEGAQKIIDEQSQALSGLLHEKVPIKYTSPDESNKADARRFCPAGIDQVCAMRMYIVICMHILCARVSMLVCAKNQNSRRASGHG
jgi:hypothetical protein